jgi:hypothetical protein
VRRSARIAEPPERNRNGSWFPACARSWSAPEPRRPGTISCPIRSRATPARPRLRKQRACSPCINIRTGSRRSWSSKAKRSPRRRDRERPAMAEQNLLRGALRKRGDQGVQARRAHLQAALRGRQPGADHLRTAAAHRRRQAPSRARGSSGGLPVRYSSCFGVWPWIRTTPPGRATRFIPAKISSLKAGDSTLTPRAAASFRALAMPLSAMSVTTTR